jgi:hypothetical protein
MKIMRKKITVKEFFKAIFTMIWFMILAFSGFVDKDELYRDIKKPHTD